MVRTSMDLSCITTTRQLIDQDSYYIINNLYYVIVITR